MGRTPPREVLAVLRRAGFEQVSQRGSHIKLRNPAGRTAIVPNYAEIARGTMWPISRQADLTVEEFEKVV